MPLDASPATLVRSMRGEIIAAQLGHPGVLHVQIRDDKGGIWRLASQGAEWSPAEPLELVGQTIGRTDLDPIAGELRCVCEDVTLVLAPTGEVLADDPPAWELIDPSGTGLEFGPGVRWRIAGAGATA